MAGHSNQAPTERDRIARREREADAPSPRAVRRAIRSRSIRYASFAWTIEGGGGTARGEGYATTSTEQL